MTSVNRSSVIRIRKASWRCPRWTPAPRPGPGAPRPPEGAVDGLVVGDVAHHAEQTLRGAGSAVRHRHLVPVGGQPLRDGQADAPRFPPVTSTERETNGAAPAAVSDVAGVSSGFAQPRQLSACGRRAEIDTRARTDHPWGRAASWVSQAGGG